MSLKTVTITELESMIRAYVGEKKSTRPQYSVRNQAARWDMAHSTLQKVISGERQLGTRTARKLAVIFNVKLSETKRPRRSPEDRWNFGRLDAHSAEQVSWVNLAILELMKLEDFEPTAEWVASRMRLDVDVTELILQKMEKAGMLERDGDTWNDLLQDSVVAVSNFVTTEAIRKSIVDLLGVSAKTVTQVPYEKREHSFHLIPVAESQVPRLRRRLSEIRLEFTQATQNSKNPKDQVYAFQLGFFPVTQKK